MTIDWRAMQMIVNVTGKSFIAIRNITRKARTQTQNADPLQMIVKDFRHSFFEEIIKSDSIKLGEKWLQKQPYFYIMTNSTASSYAKLW